MYLISILTNTNADFETWTDIAQVSGDEIAYEIYRKTCDLAELLNTTCALILFETGEIIDSFNSEV